MGAAHPEEPEPRKPVLSPFVARHLPQFVLGGAAVLAALGVGVVYVTREPTGAIGAGEGRLEPLSSPMRIAMRDQAVARPSSPPTAAANPAAGAAPAAAVQQKTEAPNAEHAGRRMSIDDEPSSVRPPRPMGEAREIAPRAMKPPVDAASTARRTERAKDPEEATEAPAKATPRKSMPALQITTDLTRDRVAASEEVASALPAPAKNPVTATAAAVLQPVPTQAAPVQATPVLPQPTSTEPSSNQAAVAQPINAQPAVVTTAQVQSSPAPPPPIPRQVTPADLANLVSQLSATYAKGDIEPFVALFSADARDEVGGKDHIRSDYTNLFQSTAARQLYVWDMSWKSEGGVYRGEGNYQAKVVRKGEDQAHVYEGKLKLEVVQVNGAPRVRAMYH
jgi:hypothetical protein